MNASGSVSSLDLIQHGQKVQNAVLQLKMLQKVSNPAQTEMLLRIWVVENPDSTKLSPGGHGIEKGAENHRTL